MQLGMVERETGGGGFPSSDAFDASLHLRTSVVLSTLFI